MNRYQGGQRVGLTGFKAVDEWDRGVVFRFGKYRTTKDPGPRWIFPFIDTMRRVSVQTVTLPIDKQKIITRDSVSVGLAGVAYYTVVDPVKSVVAVEDVQKAVFQIAQTTIRNVIGQCSLDEFLSDTESQSNRIKDLLDHTTENWGIKIERVEVKDIELPASMERAMAQAAEAQRGKAAKIIEAEGEAESVAKLAEAADQIAQHPVALHLRNLQVLGQIAAENNSTIVIPAQMLSSLQAVNQFVASETAGTQAAPAAPTTTGGTDSLAV